MPKRRRRPPHLLLIALFFPPSRASGVYRPLAMANHFAAKGWRVTVITAPESFTEDLTGSTDSSLLERIHPAVRVERAKVPAGHLVTDVRRMSRLRANLPRIYSVRTKLLNRFYFPDRYATWAPYVVARTLKVHLRSRVDVVLATGNPWVAFKAAHDIHALLRIPYVMDYRDSWTLDQFTERAKFSKSSPQGRAEDQLMASAARVLFVNEPMREWHAKRYPQHEGVMRVVENGYDPELLRPPVLREIAPDEPLRFGYVGTVTPQLPHAETWQGWRLARQEPELAGATVRVYGHLGFFATGRDEIRRLMPGEDEGVFWEGPVEKATVGDAYDDLDVMLMMIPSSRFVTAGKTYEYMSTGKPIVAIHSPETAATEPLRGYPLWFPVARLDAPSVRDAMVAAARARRTMTPAEHAACLQHAASHQRSVQLERLAAELDEVIHG